MNIHPFETLALSNGAKLLFTPCPGTKAVNLEQSILQLKQQGVSMLLTLMFDKEMLENNAIKLPLLCHKYKIQWLQLPIIDDEAPQEAFHQEWQKKKDRILNEIKNRGVVAVHCKGGTGRTGTVISLLLLQLGWSADEIKQEVQLIKPKALRIQKQINYLNSQLKNSADKF
ncbi:protein phosphatase [Colwellia demingiae]|uniref:Protein phosphatase n=1 Tax=Colwellia demingiae TaxID=89401 RepID=A0A5C6QDZ5_9GAMM|nr:tyrosine-protein phosphatase [Colwellia demingiae]TWX67265.1 protein phosphatase [Colwellia demingiae]